VRRDAPSNPPVTPWVGASTGAVNATGAAASTDLEFPQPMALKGEAGTGRAGSSELEKC
jgi:hypothetical protein